ncbi:uncharacterized protein LOC132272514 [Cornus florida]|uniref:uncharacterized protein LOC132272514 n=1 Tax=Cornus florida TaxID=4283 RepID=UPI002898321D|nr:uncharacterized protein LOC132272514 [Cornus florida]
MAEHSHSRSPPNNNLLGIGGFCKAYKSVFSRRHHEKNSSRRKVDKENRFKSMDHIAFIDETNKMLNEEKIINGEHDFRFNGDGFMSPRIFIKHRSVDNFFSDTPSPLSKSPSPRESPGTLSRSASRRSTTPTPTPTPSASATPRESPSLSRNASKRSPTPTPRATTTPRGSPSFLRSASKRSPTPTPRATTTPRESPSFSRSTSKTSLTPTPRATTTPRESPSFSRSASKRSPTPTPNATTTALLKNMSWICMDVHSPVASLSRSASRMSPPTPIMFSNSNGYMKAPAVEEKLECTLEELCFGCIKKIMITRDVVTNHGEIIQEDEMLTINVKPGWRKGTEIKFEGMGNETPNTLPADITFLISEKRHPLFRREGNDLELIVEMPLVKALTGCTLSVPLLGGEKMSLGITDIIYPGYEKIIAGQGMPKPKEQGRRGNLIMKFIIEFPTDLTEEQRSELFSILQDAC